MLVGCVAAFAVVCEYSVHTLEQTRQKIQNARNSYIQALTQTRAQLAHQLKSLASDPVLISDLNAQLSYSIARTLESEVHPSSFDFYAVFDSSCKPLAKTNIIPVPQGLCHPKLVTNTWRWMSVNQKPLLYMVRSRSNGDKPFSIAAGRFLNESWLQAFPQLSNQLKEAELAWGLPSQAPLCQWTRYCKEFTHNVWIEGQDETGVGLASLVSQSKLFPLLRPWLLSPQPLQNPLGPALVFLFFVFLGLEFFSRRLQKTRQEENKQRFLNWCTQPLSGRAVTPEFPWLETAQNSLASVLTSGANRCSELAQANEHYLREHTRLSTALAESREKLCVQDPHKVLASQIADSAPKVQGTVSGLMEANADLISLLEKGLVPPNRKLLEMIKTWQNGMSVRGERYFMRSLYEEPGREEGESLLKSELKRLFSYAEQMQGVLIHILNLGHQIEAMETQTLKFLENWTLLAVRLHSQELPLNKVGEAAVGLLENKNMQRLSFISSVPSNFSLQIPTQLLLSLLYQVFSAMKDGARHANDETLVFQMHKRHKQEQCVLAFSITNERGKPVVSHPSDEKLEEIEETFNTWGIQCQEIFRPDGGTYVVVKVREGEAFLRSVITTPKADPLTTSRGQDPEADRRSGDLNAHENGLGS